MRFMLLMIPKGYETAAPGAMPEAEAVAAMMKYNASLQKAGVLLALDGLHPLSMGARVSFSGGKPRVTDGPSIEAGEVLGGYWMIQAGSKEEAIEWASRCPASEDEVIEIRQVLEMSDFPADVQEAAGSSASAALRDAARPLRGPEAWGFMSLAKHPRSGPEGPTPCAPGDRGNEGACGASCRGRLFLGRGINQHPRRVAAPSTPTCRWSPVH